MSTGATKGAGFSGSRVILNIYCPRGTQALYCEPFSHYGHGVHGKRGQNYGDGRNWDGVQKQSIYGDEFEILLQRGTEFKITKAEYNSKSNRWYIDLDIISQSYTPIT